MCQQTANNATHLPQVEELRELLDRDFAQAPHRFTPEEDYLAEEEAQHRLLQRSMHASSRHTGALEHRLSARISGGPPAGGASGRLNMWLADNHLRSSRQSPRSSARRLGSQEPLLGQPDSGAASGAATPAAFASPRGLPGFGRLVHLVSALAFSRTAEHAAEQRA